MLMMIRERGLHCQVNRNLADLVISREGYAVEQRNYGRLETATDRSDMRGNSLIAHTHLLEPECFGVDPARSHGADGGGSRLVAVAKSPVGIALCC